MVVFLSVVVCMSFFSSKGCADASTMGLFDQIGNDLFFIKQILSFFRATHTSFVLGVVEIVESLKYHLLSRMLIAIFLNEVIFKK